MTDAFNREMTRRTLLRYGLGTAALATLPSWVAPRFADAQAANPHLIVTFFADGGWDPTQVFDVHDPLDATDGIDVDVPEIISGLPPSIPAAIGGLSYMSNPVTRPAIDAFFQAHAGRCAIVNGISTRSTSHDQSAQLMMTGYLDPTRADFAVMAAHKNGVDLPLPHLLLSGPAFGGPFAGLSGRVGGQLGQALAYNAFPSVANPNTPNQAVSALGEAYIQQALQKQQAHEAGLIAGKLDAYHDAQTRGDKLVRLATSLPQGGGTGAQLATSLGTAFRQGLTTSVTLGRFGGFDTHGDNTEQNARFTSLFMFLQEFADGLAAEPGLVAASLLDETTIIYLSEFGRTPKLNGDNGKDHHPFTSALLVGKRVRPGVYGRTDGDQEGVKIDLATGQPSAAGAVLDVTNFVAGVVTLAGANPSEYMPASVPPLSAIVNA